MTKVEAGSYTKTFVVLSWKRDLYTQEMALPIPDIQQALKEDGIDAWLLYDFHGSNPIAARLTGLDASSKMATRRWYYLVPAVGAPRGLVHAIERHNLDALPGEKRPYAGREELAAGLRDLLHGLTRVAMEYSPGNAIPYISRVDAGTVEAVRGLGIDVVSSGDLVQRFEAIWTPDALATHRAASERLYRVKDRAFALVRERLAAGAAVDEYEVQQAMLQWFTEEGLTSEDAPCVSAQENAGNPHYQPTAHTHRPIRPNEGVAPSICGASCRPRAQHLKRHHVDGVHGTRRAGTVLTGICRRPGRARRGGGARQDRRTRRPRAARVRSRPCGAHRHRARRLRSAVHPSNRAQPRPARARQRRPHGRLRNARRAAG